MILTVKTKSRTELVDITSRVQDMVESVNISDGFCLLYVPHTTAAVTINESADPSVRADIAMILDRIVPWEAGYRHLEGNSASDLIDNGRLTLGTWQGIFFCEFDGPRTRKIHVNITGSSWHKI